MKDEEIIKENIEREEVENQNNVDDITFVESTEDGEALLSKDVLKKIKEELKNCKKEKEDYLIGWQRAKADYINLQKECGESNLKNSIIVKEKFLRNLLPALDSFDVAFANKESWESVDKNWRMGMEYIYQQLITGLLDSGIDRIDKEDIIFDPFIHESVEIIFINDKSKDHLVSKIIQTGYKIGDRVIRPARVNIYQHKED